MRLPPRPDLEWKEDGTPVDRRIGDVYYSVEDGLAESRAVFLAGCDLPQAWQDRASFTIAELGFGTGLNFLATWQMWQANRAADGWLHFVSFEGFPLDRDDINQALKPWPELQPLADQLCDHWPPRAKGVRQIIWPEERLTLTLHFGLIEETLPQAEILADAWYLDGFSPAKNQAMWADTLWNQMADRSAPGARAATFTVAGAVRRGLSEAGFSVEKRPGHGRKRERLEAQYVPVEPPMTRASLSSPKIAIIGAGIAGACLANTLTQRGGVVTVWDQASGPAQGTSGNPLALVMPRLDAAETEEARLLVDAYLSAQAFYRGRAGITEIETVHRPRDAAEAARIEKLLADAPLGLGQLEALPGTGLLHKRAMAIRPQALLPHLLSGIEIKWGEAAQIDFAERTVNGEGFDVIIVATGWKMQSALAELNLVSRLGQIEWIDTDIHALGSAIAAGGYAIAAGRTRLWGATYSDHDGGIPQIEEASQVENNRALESIAPYWWQQIREHPIQSRAGVRASTADRLPLIGAWPDIAAMRADRPKLERAGWKIATTDYCATGIYIAGGFGSRGFTWAPWAAEIIRADIFNDPRPARSDSLRAVVPNRQYLRVLRRSDSE